LRPIPRNWRQKSEMATTTRRIERIPGQELGMATFAERWAALARSRSQIATFAGTQTAPRPAPAPARA
jgi:hypothetical protein